MKFENLLTEEDFHVAFQMVGAVIGERALRQPDLVIAPDGEPYLYRWHLIPREKKANVYFHIQIKSDPERPLHDHPWDNMTTVLSGGYDEIIDFEPWMEWHHHDGQGKNYVKRPIRRGDVVFRRASEAHRLILPSDIPYSMTIFSTGPVVRDWGFWFPDGWRDANLVTRLDPETRMSIHTGHE